MRTTLDLPQDLLLKAQRCAHTRTKTETIVLGLKALLRQEKLNLLSSLRGKLPLQIDLRKSRGRT